MTDDREPFRTARDAGLKQRHEQRLAHAQAVEKSADEAVEKWYAAMDSDADASLPVGAYRTEEEVRALCATASKLGYELGRKEAAEAIEKAILEHRNADDSTREFRLGLSLGAKFARDIGKGEPK